MRWSARTGPASRRSPSHRRRYRADGRARDNGRPRSFVRLSEALRARLTMVFQETSLVPSMTVAQNLYLGDEKFFNRLRGLYIAAQQLLQSLNFQVDPGRRSRRSARRKADGRDRARGAQNARVIVFDEPTAIADSGREAAFLSADAEAEGERRRRSSSFRTRSKRRWSSPIALRSCATAK